MVNQQFYNLQYYDTNWWNQNVISAKKDLLTFVNFQLIDLSSAGLQTSGSAVHFFYHHSLLYLPTEFY